MILESEIRKRLVEVLSRSLSIEDFEDWLDSESWNMHADSDPAAVNLASMLHLLFSEYSGHYLDEQALRGELLALVANSVVLVDSIKIENDLSVSSSPVEHYSASPSFWVNPVARISLPASA